MMTLAWIDAAREMLRHETSLVRVTVAGVRGSGPREPGATLLVTHTSQRGTIGGGHLEWLATEQARRLIAQPGLPAVQVEALKLGPDLAQCCGGEVVLWLERLTAEMLQPLADLVATREPGSSFAVRTRWHRGALQRERCEFGSSPASCRLRFDGDTAELEEQWQPPARPLWIFGAGHVGRALVRMLEDLPLFDVTWIDSREGQLPVPSAAHIRAVHAAEPVEQVRLAPAGTAWLVLTHDHELDYQICTAVLARGDAAWTGLIGSQSKAARFRSRLRRDGLPQGRIDSLQCPVGMTQITSKLPAAIAVGILAELLATPGPATTGITAAGAVNACDAQCSGCGKHAVLAELRS